MGAGIAKLDWDDFKTTVIDKGMPWQWTITKKVYWLTASDGPYSYQCIIRIEDPAQDDAQIDFETNYKDLPPKPVVPTDSDGAALTKPKTTKAGWHYAPRWITWTTATYGSLHNKKIDTTTDWADAVLRFWKLTGTPAVAWTELKREDYADDAAFQAALSSECTLTTLDWETTYDFDIRGAGFLLGLRPASPTYGYVAAAPDIPVVYGGTIPFLEGGVPLHLFADYAFVPFDGSTVKSITADPVFHSNKFRIIIEHVAGAAQTMAVGWQQFKA